MPEPRHGAWPGRDNPAVLPPIEFPEALPVSARRDEIAAAMRANPVVIVCGETGSGKTTQLPQCLRRRMDLRLVVTSATIDADRFARHFAGAGGPAPVIQVSGRLYPVEIRWRPFVESRDHDLGDAICDAVDELWRGPGAAGS